MKEVEALLAASSAVEKNKSTSRNKVGLVNTRGGRGLTQLTYCVVLSRRWLREGLLKIY